MSRGATTSVAVLAFLLTARVCFAEAGAPSFPEAGARDCQGSDGCAAPTPYCHSTLHQCVECETSINCRDHLVCDQESGTCVTCMADGDCGSKWPYCVEGACVECRGDANCAADGLRCVNGACGTCGDGVCGPRERVAIPGREEPGADYSACAEDCRSECTSATVELDGKATLKIGSHSAFEGPCSFGTPDAMVSFTAPEKGRYWFTATRQGDTAPGSYLFVQAMRGECPTVTFEDCSSGETEAYQRVDATAGESFTVVIDAAEAGTYDVSVSTKTPPCRGSFCVPPPPDASVSNEANAARCLESAKDRGEGACDGVQCARNHCPRDYDDCQIIPGCVAVSECMRERGCTGNDCLSASTCDGVINTHGGKGAPAFRAARALRTCTLTNACFLPCTDGGTNADAGIALCSPGEERACSCGEGGTGEQRCDDDGSGYGACRCEAAPPRAATESSCDCGLARAGSSGVGVVAVIGLAAAALGRRARRASRAVRARTAGGES